MDNSTFGATQKTRISLANAVTNGTRSYQKIVLTVLTNATIKNTVYLTIDSQTYSFILDSGCLGSNTVARLREFFRRALDTTFVIKSNGSDIIMYNVYGATVQNISFNGNGTGITMSISKTTESGSICTQTAGAIATNSIVEVNSIYNFGGGTLTIPADCTLSFNNGCILNARLQYDNTLIDGDYNILNCICSGKLANAEVYPEMFGALTSNFRKDKYDLSVAIQNALNGGNMNIVIDSKKVTKDGYHYEWRHTVSLFVPSSSAPTSDDNLWSLSIRGNAGAPMTSVGPIAKCHQILVLTETVFLCGGHNFSFNYSNKLWPSVHLSNLSFRFQNDLEDTIFFDGVLAGSVIDGVNVYACDKFVNGGLKKTSLVANCRIEAQKYVFGGYMMDSKVENCYFTGIRKHTDTEPVFYMNSILYGSNRVTGGHWATVYSNNYIDYFPTIFVINSSCKDIISTSGNTFDIFKYFARSLYWEGTVLKDGSKTRGCRICSNGDVFMRCNNLAASEDDATDNYLTRNTYTEDGVQKKEVYSLFGKLIHNSVFQVNSIIADTCEYIFAKDGVKTDGTETAEISSNPSFGMTGSAQYHNGEFICGGRASMYYFTHLSSSTEYMSQGVSFRRPAFLDLQDMSVSSLPEVQRFNGRRIIYNNKIYTFKQTDSRMGIGTWEE